MKKFLVFACDTYYPRGGWGDYYGVYDTFEDALKACIVAKGVYDTVEVVDTDTMKVVYEGGA